MLTTNQFKALQPRESRYEVRDGGGSPLIIQVCPPKRGSKIVTKEFHVRHNGKRRKLGCDKTMTLAQARAAAVATKGTIKQEAAAPVTTALVTPTVQMMWDDYILWFEEVKEGARPWERESSYKRDIKPFIGHVPMSDVTRLELEEIVVRKYEALTEGEGNGRGANRLHSLLQALWTYSMKQGWRKSQLDLRLPNPMSLIEKPTAEGSRDVKLTDREIVLFFKALSAAGEFGVGSGDLTLRLQTLLRFPSFFLTLLPSLLGRIRLIEEFPKAHHVFSLS